MAQLAAKGPWVSLDILLARDEAIYGGQLLRLLQLLKERNAELVE